MVTVPSATNIAAFEFSAQSQLNPDAVPDLKPNVQIGKRNKAPGIRVVGNRIYDSSNGVSCHQCRQKTLDFTASCKNVKNGGRPCLIKYCRKCLNNRYGENVEEVDLKREWKCPKCMGICNCSCCMRKSGGGPTGQLVKTAKALGYQSVSDMLRAKQASKSSEADKDAMKTGADNSSVDKVHLSNAVPHIKPFSPKKELVVCVPREPGKENPLDAHNGLKLKKTKREGLKEISNGEGTDGAAGKNNKRKRQRVANADVKDGAVLPAVVDFNPKDCAENDGPEVTLPSGTLLTDVWGIQFLPTDMGNIFQFLEFCRSFGEILDVKEGEAEAVLRELASSHTSRRGQNTLVVQFHIRVLTLILIDSGISDPSLTTGRGKNSWLKALEALISKSSELELKEFPLDWFEEGIGGYHDLNVSQKLSLLIFLCDKVLCTEKFRNHIDKDNLKFSEEKKEAKSKVAAAKEKKKKLKQKLQDKVAKAIVQNGAPLSIAEHETLVEKIKSDSAQAHAEVLEAMGAIPIGKQCSDATRTEPVFVDGTGWTFWNFKSYDADYAFLVQKIAMEDQTFAIAEERWLIYGPEKKDEVNNYISSRARRPKIRMVNSILTNGSSEVHS